jgi:LmbE family N-acetylglucosaminyl deacetylase
MTSLPVSPSIDLIIPGAPPGRVLAIGAHPDDVEFGCGATLAKWSARGAHCELLVLTDGSKGTWDPGADTNQLVATREAEQEVAAARLGAKAVHFGRAVDGELDADRAMRKQVCSVIRAFRPDVVLGHDPWKQYRLHPDHRAAGQLVIDGIVAARDPHFFRDAGEPHRPSALLLFEAQVVDHLESVDDVAIDAKIDALLAHHSQWRSTMNIDPDASRVELQTQRDAFTARVRADLADGPAGTAEAFKLITEL